MISKIREAIPETPIIPAPSILIKETSSILVTPLIKYFEFSESFEINVPSPLGFNVFLI